MNDEDKKIEKLKAEIKEELQKESKKRSIFSGLKFKTKLIMFLLAIIIIAVVASGIYLKLNKENDKQVLLNFGFKDVGELVTQEWYGRILKDKSKDRKFFDLFPIPGTQSRLVFSLDVEVTAGVDFREIEWTKNDAKKVIYVKMPKAKVYKYYQVPNTFISYVEDESWFTNMTSEWRHKLEDQVVEDGKKKAVELGLLEKADKNAQSIITQMINSNEMTKDYKVEFEYK